MFLIEKLILVAALLMVLGVLSSKFSTRLGLPVLVLFLGLGMLAGIEGPGGIDFENYVVAHGVGTVALAVILFDGGLRTPLGAFKLVWKPAALLATVGVFVTSVVTGLGAAWALKLPLLEGVLLGSIVGSTDAAAVFALLRNAGVRLRRRVAATLEVESGSNDPMAIFLTVGLLQVLQGQMELGLGLLRLFVLQMGVGMVVGLAVGHFAGLLINRIKLGAAGLYPLLTSACGMLAFGVAAVTGGSGFLAVYVAGIVLGNKRLVFQRGTLLFHDGLAWGGQISMFVVLGLLSTPSRLLPVAGPALLISLVLFVLARPLGVAPLLLPFGFSWREILLISWVGLKGAVPIVLATFPLLFGLASGPLLFNAVFFVVLLSAIVQGSSLAPLARRLGLEEAAEQEPPVSLEITSLVDVDADIVEYTVGERTRAAGRRLHQLALPEGAVVAMISRGKSLIPPSGATQVLAGDHVFVVLRSATRILVDRVFSRDPASVPQLPSLVEFPLLGSAKVEDLADLYGIHLERERGRTLDEMLRARLGDGLREGATLSIEGFTLRVRQIVDGHVSSVGLAIPDSGED